MTRGPTRRGFSTIELATVGVLISVLGLILSSVWRGLALPSLSAAAQCKIAQEAAFAADSLANDLGGTYANPSGRLGLKTDGRLLSVQAPDLASLVLTYDNGSHAARVVTYSFNPGTGQLVRDDSAAGTSLAVASALTEFLIAPYSDDAGNTGFTLSLTFTARDLTRTSTLVVIQPPS